jgi:hypothetical protein
MYSPNRGERENWKMGYLGSADVTLVGKGIEHGSWF